tara:strand:+ start:184 stop:711 length:528 start_codon:yes stop_codon:yes gene_type:complete
MNKYIIWFFFAGLLFGQTNSYIVPKKQKELTKVSVEAQKKITVDNSVKLNLERKAIYDAHLDAKKWLFYPILSGLSLGSIVIGSMLVTQNEPWESATAMTLIASTSLVSSYFILKSDNDKFAAATYNIKPELLESYKNAYIKKFGIETSKNIVIGSAIISLAASTGYIFLLETLI